MPRDLYSAAWDFGRMNLGAVTAGVNGATFGGGTLTGTAGFTTGMYLHGDTARPSSQTVDGVALASWRAAVVAMVAGGLVVTYSPANNQYLLSCASTFSVTWHGLLGAELRDIFGFEASLSGQIFYLSTKRPKYTCISVIGGQSRDSGTFEAPGKIDYAEADDGSAYSTYPDRIATYRDWSQPMESPTGPTNAAWNAAAAVGGAPVRRTDIGSSTKVWWSWEDFYKHTRATLPYLLIDRVASVKGEGDLYKMREETASWKPERVTPDFDGHWTLPFMARYIDATVAL